MKHTSVQALGFVSLRLQGLLEASLPYLLLSEIELWVPTVLHNPEFYPINTEYTRPRRR
jgi:hypothetical protein